jgi:plastocyanin
MNLIRTLLVAAAVALVVTAAATPMAPPKLTGTVGPGFTITLKRNGVLVRTVRAGRYMFLVSDKSGIHNFELEGPGIDRAITTVPFRGTKTVTLLLKRGTYKYYCKPHESTMHGSIRVR